MPLPAASARNFIAAIVVAAGRGVRAGGEIPKQYRLLAGIPVLHRTLSTLLRHECCDAVVTVIHPDDVALYRMAVDGISGDGRLLPPVFGGENRQISVKNGLEALIPRAPSQVLIHDAVRPFASPALYDAVLAATTAQNAAIAATPVTDTIKKSTTDGRIAATLDRAGLWAAQTPQGFRFDLILAAHRAAADAGRADFTDDAALLEWRGEPVALVPGEVDNLKLTRPEDFARAERLLAAEAPAVTVTGIGYDVHAFTEGDHVAIGGVTLPHDRGVAAHSDGDVVLHALTDAILGALAEGDIGVHFPPSDPEWRGASSDRFLAFAAGRVRARGGTIRHLDVTVVAEAPRIGPHREAMRAAIARASGTSVERISIKATTSEKLGFTGRREGLAALAVATLTLPSPGRPT